jgi:hypothetical protein
MATLSPHKNATVGSELSKILPAVGNLENSVALVVTYQK